MTRSLRIEKFVAEMVDYGKGYNEIPEISREQKFLNRPKLEELFTNTIRKNINKRNKRIILAIYDYGYKQKKLRFSRIVFYID